MPIDVRAYSDADDVQIGWRPDPWDAGWMGFQLERRDEATQGVAVLANRIPSQQGGAPVPDGGVSSALSPIRRCLWTDHGLPSSGRVSYRVTPMRAAAGGTFEADAAAASDWLPAATVTGDAGEGLAAYFNRGTLMSQVVGRFVKGT